MSHSSNSMKFLWKLQRVTLEAKFFTVLHQHFSLFSNYLAKQQLLVSHSLLSPHSLTHSLSLSLSLSLYLTFCYRQHSNDWKNRENSNRYIFLFLNRVHSSPFHQNLNVSTFTSFYFATVFTKFSEFYEFRETDVSGQEQKFTYLLLQQVQHMLLS
jgi:hypothetical protein